MGKSLTKNARWIVTWLRVQSDTPLAKPQETVHNLGRWPYEVSETQAMSKALDLHNDKLLAFKNYLIDVQLFPYAKQHKEVTAIAENWFRTHGGKP